MAVFLTIPTTAGNYASAPNNAAYDVTDVDVRVALTFDWDDAGTQYFFSTHDATGDGAGFAFGIEPDEQLRFYWAETGVSSGEYVSSNANMRTVSGLSNGDLLALRLTVDADNDSSDADVSFYYKSTAASTVYADCLANTGWTQLGTTQNAGYALTINATPASLKIGALNASGGNADGNYYAAVLLDGIEGTAVFAEDFTAEAVGATTITEDSANAATVTINQAGSPQASISTDDPTYGSITTTVYDYALADLAVSDTPGE